VGELAEVADEVVCLTAPAHFDAVGRYYRDFSPVEERTVRALLVPSADG
jgi:predicted phosphoribosyltransferase